ncbi:hypothetical protein GY45DRAFT_880758 [Cubamyces sp. BRFM 1775]|nr:hypothetical protein GY45DRAFT_880758 [Cubamyces sp. BRFM 1775]
MYSLALALVAMPVASALARPFRRNHRLNRNIIPGSMSFPRPTLILASPITARFASCICYTRRVPCTSCGLPQPNLVDSAT